MSAHDERLYRPREEFKVLKTFIKERDLLSILIHTWYTNILKISFMFYLLYAFKELFNTW